MIAIEEDTNILAIRTNAQDFGTFRVREHEYAHCMGGSRWGTGVMDPHGKSQKYRVS